MLAGISSAVGPAWITVDDDDLLRHLVDTGRRTLGLRNHAAMPTSERNSFMKTAVVTGGASGIGQAIAARLARRRASCRDDRSAGLGGRLRLHRRRHRPSSGRRRARQDPHAARPCLDSGECGWARRVLTLHRHIVRRLAAGDQRQPARRLPLLPSHHSRDGRRGLGPDREHQLVEHALGCGAHDALRRGQVGRQRADQIAGARVRAQRHHRQRHPAGLHRHADVARRRKARRHEFRAGARDDAGAPEGRPEDIAAACAFLVSEEAGYITGQILGVNGGRNT